MLALLACICVAPLYGGAVSERVPENAGIGLGNTPESPIEFSTIVVNGRKLAGPSSRARRRSGLLMIPVSMVSRALGDVLTVDVARRTVNVRRQNGTTADFDAITGKVKENGAVVLVVSSAASVIFSPSAEDLFLQSDIAAALFEASIRYENDKNEVVITRGLDQTAATSRTSQQRTIDVYQVDFNYDLSRYSSVSSQNLTLSAVGNIADGRFSFLSNSERTTGRGVEIRNTLFRLERPNGQVFIAGDFGTASNLQFLSANVRGGSVSIPIGGNTVTAYGGRLFSGISAPSVDPARPPVRDSIRYDTNIFGVHTTTPDTAGPRKSSPLTFSAGLMRFSGTNRSGELGAGSVIFDNPRLRVQSDFGFGKFSGFRPDNSPISGIGAAADVAATINLAETLTLNGRYTYVGQDFISPQQGFREPTHVKSGGIRYSPTKWLTATMHGGSVRHPGDNTQVNRFVTTALGITPGGRFPVLFVSHTRSQTNLGTTDFTLANASKDIRRVRLFLNATRVKAIGPAAFNTNLNASYMISDRNSIEFGQGFGSGRSYNGQLDWRTSSLANQRLGLSMGAGYYYTRTAGFTGVGRLSASLNLPGRTSLQLNYIRTNPGTAVFFSVKGSLFRKREAQGFLDSAVSEMNAFGKLTGRVYQDVDQNGRFDAGVDLPQANVRVRVDGNRYVLSNSNGEYEFTSVSAGDHRVYVDLLSVRADLTLLGEAGQDTKLSPQTSMVHDFRLVRTGRISGRVWADTNENGKFDDGETPLSDVRIVTSSGRDTLTDNDGYFTLADIVPGEYTILIDEKTLPEKTVAKSRSMAVQVFAGRETSDVDLGVIAQPAEIKRFGQRTGN